MEQNLPLVSVIIPVYRVEKYLEECLKSVINQTYKNIEIILVDDGSPDSCGKICDEYSEKDSRVQVIHKANGGVSPQKMYKFFAIYMMYVLGNIGYAEMFSRPLFLFGSLAPVLSSFYTDEKIQLNKENITKSDHVMTLCIKAAVLAVCIASQYMSIRGYGNNFWHK